MEEIISINPATEEILGKTPISSPEQVSKAVQHAHIAKSMWQKMPYSEKCSRLKDIASEFRKKKEFLADLITREMGKPLNESLSEVENSIEKIEYFIKNVKKFTKSEKIDKYTRVYYEPIGVVGIITPWNFPFSLPNWSIPANLLIGNTIVFKPSELTTMVGIELAKIYNKFLPGYVLNLITGGDDVGKTLVKSDIQMISFVGSKNAGKDIVRNSADTLKKVVLELGGKDPAIVLDDADFSETAKRIVSSSLRNCGQVCCSIERVYVTENVPKSFIEKIVEEVKKVKIGNGFDNPYIGPMVSKPQLEKFMNHIKDAEDKGAKVIHSGKTIDTTGYFHEPVVLTNVNNTMKIMKEETFGPAIPIEIVKDADEAVIKANSLPYGLTASVWTKDLDKAESIAKKLEAGSVGINTTAASRNDAPWGGVKQSGLGRSLSKHGIREFTEIKVVVRKS